jgi:hypothetical protein
MIIILIIIAIANMGGVGTHVKSKVCVVDKRNQRNFVGYVC